jgi:hypothetical protein
MTTQRDKNYEKKLIRKNVTRNQKKRCISYKSSGGGINVTPLKQCHARNVTCDFSKPTRERRVKSEKESYRTDLKTRFFSTHFISTHNRLI